jgi:hypothetical protein
MKIMIESTTQIVEANGIQFRVWEGESERGVKVQCLIMRVVAREDAGRGLEQFEADLQECRPPSPDFNPFPLRMIL